MNKKDKQVIIKALGAIASALSFCDTDAQLILHDRLSTIYNAIDELRGDTK